MKADDERLEDYVSPAPRTPYMESMAEIVYRNEHDGPKPRPITYKGIEFRSTLEVAFARHLDAIGERWAYEPRVYGPKGRGYLPDFEILDGPRKAFIEVKPRLVEVPAAKRKMAVIWESEPDALLMVMSAEGCTYFAALRGERWRSWQERWAA